MAVNDFFPPFNSQRNISQVTLVQLLKPVSLSHTHPVCSYTCEPVKLRNLFAPTALQLQQRHKGGTVLKIWPDIIFNPTPSCLIITLTI